MSEVADFPVDVIEAGTAGPIVVLVHASASNARQWTRLIDDLKDRFRVRAVNLFGYGKTPAWSGGRTQRLDDQARLVAAALPRDADAICLVGHSFGATVAMKTAARLFGRVDKLVLIETNPFNLLAQHGRADALTEAMALRDCVKAYGDRGEWAIAAEIFADYWGGAGTWSGMRPERRAAFAQAMQPNYFEWDAAMNDTTTPEQWAALLPKDTLLIDDSRSALPICEVSAILRRANPAWFYRDVPGAGHMAPLTRPDVINPLVVEFLCTESASGVSLVTRRRASAV